MRISPLLPALLLAITSMTYVRAAEDAMVRREWMVNGVTREALVYAPAKAKDTPSPVVFIFHGHNGNMQGFARKNPMHELWPEAIVVCPQGLNTTSSSDPEGKLAGWQRRPGQDNDRDLHLFDAMLASLKAEYKVDSQRIYAAGHSNGGAFTYLLWGTRGEIFAALAPVASIVLLSDEEAVTKLPPRPVLHVAGREDKIVMFDKQQQTMELIRKVNQCGAGEPWGPEYSTLYPSKVGAPVVTYIHPAAHGFPEDAKTAVVKFFQGQVKR